MAMELELHRPSHFVYDERENLNRTRSETNVVVYIASHFMLPRTWFNCFCVDMSHATQFGKIPLLQPGDFLTRNAREWYRSSPLNLSIDIHLCQYVEMLVIMDEFRGVIGDKAQHVQHKVDEFPSRTNIH